MHQLQKILYSERMIDAVSYWERRRIAYNLVLAVLAILCWGPTILSGRATDFIAGIVVLLVFAVPANLCYCTAYPVDLVMQFTPLRRYWQRSRWLLFLSGTVLASALAVWIMVGDHMA